MAFNIPGTDIVFRDSSILKTIGLSLNFLNTFTDFLQPFNFVSKIGNLIGGWIFGNDKLGDDNTFRGTLIERSGQVTGELDKFRSNLGNSSQGTDFLDISHPTLGSTINDKIYSSRSVPRSLIRNFSQWSIRQIFSGEASGAIAHDFGREFAFRWWNDAMNWAAPHLSSIQPVFEEYSYNLAEQDYNNTYPQQSQNISFAEFSGEIIENGIDTAEAERLVDNGFSGNEVADFNGGTINIGGQDFLTTDGLRLQDIRDTIVELANQTTGDLDSSKDAMGQLIDDANLELSNTQTLIDDIGSELETSGLIDSENTNLLLEQRALEGLKLTQNTISRDQLMDGLSNLVVQSDGILELSEQLGNINFDATNDIELQDLQQQVQGLVDQIGSGINDFTESKNSLNEEFEGIFGDFITQKDIDIGDGIDFNFQLLLLLGAEFERKSVESARISGDIEQQEFDAKILDIDNRIQQLNLDIENRPILQQELFGNVTNIIEGASSGLKDIELQSLKLKLPELNKLPIEGVQPAQGIDPLSISIGQSLGQQQQVPPIIPQQQPEDEMLLPETEGVAPVIGDIFRANEINERLRGKF